MTLARRVITGVNPVMAMGVWLRPFAVMGGRQGVNEIREEKADEDRDIEMTPPKRAPPMRGGAHAEHR